MTRVLSSTKYLKLIFFALTFVVGAGGTTRGNDELQTPAQSKQRAAEAVADHAMQRFYETLDYSVVWKEFYVSNVALREFEVKAMTSSLVFYRAEGLSPERLSKESRERAFVAMRNFWALFSAVHFTSNKELPDSIGPLYESITQRQQPYLTSTQLDNEFTAVMDRMSNVLRGLVLPQNLGSMSYRKKLNEFVETNPSNREDMNEVFAPAGLSRAAKVYIVQRESFHIYLIEENGQYRILTVLSRIRD